MRCRKKSDRFEWILSPVHFAGVTQQNAVQLVDLALAHGRIGGQYIGQL